MRENTQSTSGKPHWPVRVGLAVAALALVLAGSLLALRHGPAAPPVACSAGSAAPGRVFHVDPRHGSDAGDGSARHPWRSLAAESRISAQRTRVSRLTRLYRRLTGHPAPFARFANPAAVIGDGDTLLLADGDHGDVDLSGLVNRAFVMIAPEPGAHPRLSSLRLDSASHFILRDIRVEGPPRRSGQPEFLVIARALPGAPPADNIRLEGLTVGSTARIADVPRDRWAREGRSGFLLTGDCLTVARSTVHDVRFGVDLYHVRQARFERNTIAGFSVDGIDFSGSDIAISGNLVQDHYATGDDLHPDCMQAQPDRPDEIGGPLRIIGNTCLAATFARTDPDEYLQGISIFTGHWHDVTVRCNLVLDHHAHGVTLFGVDRAEIADNIVAGTFPPWNSWILAMPLPDGRHPVANRIRDNVASAYLNAAHGSAHRPLDVLHALGMTADRQIIDPFLAGFGGVALARNTVLAGGNLVARQPPDPRLAVQPLAFPIAPMPLAAARARFPLGAECQDWR